ncbi:MAG: YecA family protein [Burkholderiales bacterium]|nr:YecA family protein [Burkholderiales bacterium]
MTPLTSQLPSLGDADIERLQTLLDDLPAPLQPLDVSALDGFLCGVLLQPQRPPPARWLALVTDVEGRPAPAGAALTELQALVQRRHAEVDRAITNRQWFDPWIYQLDDDAGPDECVLPWIAGFAAAMDAFPALMARTDPELVEPLALLFMHFDPDDLEDADELLAVIETLEPAADLAEAVQDIVRALMLIADVTRPRRAAAPAGPRARGPRRR